MKGFTLIELLVVVVIIGILASIALPQYEMVVEKSRATEALVNAKAIQDAIQRHIQEFPEHETTGVTNRNQIADVQLKGGSWIDGGTKFTTKNFVYELNGLTFSVTRQDNGAGPVLYSATYNSIVDDNGNRVASTNCSDGKYSSVVRLFNN